VSAAGHPNLDSSVRTVFRHDLRRPFRLVERRKLREAEQRVAEREVGKNASVKDNQWTGDHSWLGTSTRS